MFNLIQRRRERIESQLCSVRRSLRQTANRGDHPVALQRSRFVQSFSGDDLRQSRSASHRSHASLGLEPNLRNPPGIDSQSQTEYIAAGRILDFRRGIGIHEFSRVARILEVVEQLGRVHAVQIVNACIL